MRTPANRPDPDPLTITLRNYSATPGPTTRDGLPTNPQPDDHGPPPPSSRNSKVYAVDRDGYPIGQIVAKPGEPFRCFIYEDEAWLRTSDGHTIAYHKTAVDALTYLATQLDPTSPTPALTVYHCRRPYCAEEFPTQLDRDRHEETSTTRHRHMDYLCDDPGHADAVQQAGICMVCQ